MGTSSTVVVVVVFPGNKFQMCCCLSVFNGIIAYFTKFPWFYEVGIISYINEMVILNLFKMEAKRENLSDLQSPSSKHFVVKITSKRPVALLLNVWLNPVVLQVI